MHFSRLLPFSEKLIRLDDRFGLPLGHLLKFYPQMLHLVGVIFREGVLYTFFLMVA